MTKAALSDTSEAVILPFMLKKAQSPGIIVKDRAPDQPEESTDDSNDSIEACAHDLIEAVHAKDTKAAASAMKAAFEIMQSEPSSESDSNDFDSQNQKAAE